MRHTLSLLLFAVCLFALPNAVVAQAPTPPTWSVTGTGCPAASALPATLAPQWTAALAAASADPVETAIIVADRAYVTARLAQYATVNPQTMYRVLYQHIVSHANPAGTIVGGTIGVVQMPVGTTYPTS
jgi:hypothetical protein